MKMQPNRWSTGDDSVETAAGSAASEDKPVFLEDTDTGFDSFYAGSSRALLGQLYAMCGDLGEAQDCLQEAYLRAWQRWSQISTYADPSAWVRQVAWHLAVNRWHRARNAMVAWHRRGSGQLDEDAGVETAVLAKALRRLPTVQREAIVLHHLCGLSVDEVAAHCGAPVGTVKARLARGRARLARFLEEEE